MIRRTRYPSVKFVLFFSIFVAGLSWHCAATRPPDLSQLTPELVQRRVSRNFMELRSFEGKAQVIIEIPGEGHRGSSQIYIDFPDSIYVKTEAILGIDIGSLFLDKKHFGAYAPRDNTLYYGETETLDLRDFLQVEIETGELAEVLTGLIQIPVLENANLALDDGQILLTVRTDDLHRQYWIEPEKYVVTRSVYRAPDGRVLLEKESSRLKSRDGIVLPRLIKMTRPQARERITISYTRQKINERISPEEFKLKMSPNTRKVYWSDMKQPRIERK